MESIHVREVDFTDIEIIFEWANDPETRQNSHSTDAIEWAEHKKWFSESLRNSNRCLLMCCLADSSVKVGLVRFDIDNESASISYTIAPAMRKKGLAKVCLNYAIQCFKEQNAAIARINAEIKSTNVASQKAMEGVGFEFIRDEGEIGFYSLTFD